MKFQTGIIITAIVSIIVFSGCLFPIMIDIVSKQNNQEYIVDSIKEEEYETDVNTLTAGIITVLYENSVKDNIDVSDIDINTVAATPKMKVGYATTTVNIRLEPTTDAEVLGTLEINDKIKYYTKSVDDVDWCMIEYQEDLGYVRSDYISDEKVEIIEQTPTYNGEKLTRSKGVVYGPSGKETYYNLPMNGVIRLMKDLGYDCEYWVREDGCKMYGNYIMLAANTNIYPKGTIIETSLGTGWVCDHCERAEYDPVFDLAVTW